jgi:hypothetical protein
LIRTSSHTPSGKTTTTSQAPSENLVTAKTSTTATETRAAAALTPIFQVRPLSGRRR